MTPAYAITSAGIFTAVVALGLAVDHAQSRNRGWTPAWEILLFWRGRRLLPETRSAADVEHASYLSPSVPAALLVVVVVSAWWVFSRHLEDTYTTRIGEFRTIVLPDHITAVLNTDTRLTWAGTAGAPRAALLKGEVLFETSPDPARRFSVMAGNSLIRDVGTTFDVYRMGDGTVSVTVVSGTVVVRGLGSRGWEEKLDANQQIRYSQSGPVTAVHPVSALAVISWRAGFLRFPEISLGDFIRDLNRYTRKPIVLLGGASCADTKIGGAFDIRNIGYALQRLERIAAVSAQDDSNMYTVSCR